MISILAFIAAPALLIATIAGAGAAMGGVIVWARLRQRRRSRAARSTRELATPEEPASPEPRHA